MENTKKKYHIRVNMSERVNYAFEKDIDQYDYDKLVKLSKEGDDNMIAEFCSELNDPLRNAVDSDDPEVMTLQVKKGNTWEDI